MSTTNSVLTAEGMLKDIYQKGGVVDLLPINAILTKLFPFKSSERVGKNFVFPVRLTGEQGITFSAPGSGPVTLNATVAHNVEDAQVAGYQMTLPVKVDFELISRASGGDRSFEEGLTEVIDAQMSSAIRFTEVEMLYGQDGLGLVSAASAVSSTSTLVTLTTASWADGIWAGSENTVINFYNSSDVIIGTAAADREFTITAVDPDNHQITVSSTAQGATDLLAAYSSAKPYYTGAHGNEMAGLKKIITNTGSLFGISASTYNLWRGNTYNASSSALTLGKLFSATSKGVSRGLDEAATVVLNPKTWYNVMNSQAALRIYDSSYGDGKEFKNGATKIMLQGPNNATLTLVPHNVVKEGDAFILPTAQVKRIGSQDWNFMPGSGGEERFLQLVPGTTSYVINLYTTQAVFVEKPARSVYVQNIVNSLS